MVKYCNDTAKAVGSEHWCNRCKIQRDKQLRTYLKKYSTKKVEDHAFLTTLFQKTTDQTIPGGHTPQSLISQIETIFGTEFECCCNFWS